MDFQAITQVNKHWIFSTGDQKNETTPDLLREIYADAVQNAAFYRRMHQELSAIVDREREKLAARHCPTPDEIRAAGNIMDQIEPQLQREYYLHDAAKISGMYDILSEATEKHWHYEKIARQARVALDG